MERGRKEGRTNAQLQKHLPRREGRRGGGSGVCYSSIFEKDLVEEEGDVVGGEEEGRREGRVVMRDGLQ